MKHELRLMDNGKTSDRGYFPLEEATAYISAHLKLPRHYVKQWLQSKGSTEEGYYDNYTITLSDCKAHPVTLYSTLVRKHQIAEILDTIPAEIKDTVLKDMLTQS